MRRWLLALVALYAAPCAGQVLPGHRLPEGPERPVRERAFHIERYKAELFVDLDKEQISGTATLTVVSLREPLAELALDAANLSVSRIEREGKPQAFRVDEKSWKLAVALDPPLPMGRATTVARELFRSEVSAGGSPRRPRWVGEGGAGRSATGGAAASVHSRPQP
jgi:hypothetical protein